MSAFTEYLEQVTIILKELKDKEGLVLQLVDEIVARGTQGKQIITFGNGGSASTASHFANDLVKGVTAETGTGIKALCLTDNVPTITAWANDKSYTSIFAEQVKVYCQPGDFIVAISTSGNSPNVLEGVEVAKEYGATCFALCGFDGGRLAKLADHALIIPSSNIRQNEDVHLLILHLVCLLVVEKLKGLSD